MSAGCQQLVLQPLFSRLVQVHFWEIAHRPADAAIAISSLPASADFRDGARAAVLHGARSGSSLNQSALANTSRAMLRIINAHACGEMEFGNLVAPAARPIGPARLVGRHQCGLWFSANHPSSRVVSLFSVLIIGKLT